MRPLIALAFCFLLASSHAHACRGHAMEDSLFLANVPNPPPEAEVIAQVSLSHVNEGTATATVMQVLKATDARVRQGDRISMRFNYSSCGPHHQNGEEGVIIAKAGTDSESRLVLYPYVRRYGDGRITPPSM